MEKKQSQLELKTKFEELWSEENINPLRAEIFEAMYKAYNLDRESPPVTGTAEEITGIEKINIEDLPISNQDAVSFLKTVNCQYDESTDGIEYTIRYFDFLAGIKETNSYLPQ